MGYRPSGDYYAGEGEGRLFAETAQGYGRGGRAQDEELYHPAAKDPFEDQPTSGGAYGRDYDAADPYEAIRKVRFSCWGVGEERLMSCGAAVDGRSAFELLGGVAASIPSFLLGRPCGPLRRTHRNILDTLSHPSARA